MLNSLLHRPEILIPYLILTGIPSILWFVSVRRKYKKTFPNPEPAQILYRDKRASGYSLKNLLTKIGGARGCLEITVGDGELWIRLSLPFRYLYTGGEFDVAHRVKLDAILKMEKVTQFGMDGMRVEFADETSAIHRIVLFPRKLQDFEEAVRASMSQAEVGTAWEQR